MEIAHVDLDLEFLWHLGNPESLEVIKDNRIDGELLNDGLVEAVYAFQLDYYRSYGAWGPLGAIQSQFEGLELETPSLAVEFLLERLRERYSRKIAKDAVLSLGHKLKEDHSQIASAMLEEGHRLSRLLSSKTETFTQEDYDKAIHRYHLQKTEGRPPSLGFEEVDYAYHGQRGLTFLVGQPKSMKSFFTIKTMIENILLGRKVFLASLELPAQESDFRLRCMTANIPYRRYLEGHLGDNDMIALEAARELLMAGEYLIEKPPQGQRGALEMVQRARDEGCSAIFIDQLQFVENRKGIPLGSTNDTREFFDVINTFRDLSDDGPIWIVHQFRRGTNNLDSFPDMEFIKSSAAVEEAATLVLGLWASKEMKKSHIIQLGSMASRNYANRSWEIKSRMWDQCKLELIREVVDDE
jgi:hypothetical protein